MKSLKLVLLTLVLLGNGTGFAPAQTGSTAQTVAAQEQKWLASQKSNNPAALYSLLSDRFVDTGSDGKVSDKAGEIAEYKTGKWVQVDYRDVNVNVFGDTAIATGLINGRQIDNSGKSFDIARRWTDTWVKMPGGQWQCVASQATDLK